MTIHELIFSKERSVKLVRHAIFWLSWFFYMSCTQLRNQTPDEVGMKSFVIYQMSVSANRVFLQMLFCYPFIYVLIPRFFQTRKYVTFFLLLVLLLTALYGVTYVDYLNIWTDRSSPIFFDIPGIRPLTPFQARYFSVYSNIHCTGTFVAASILLAVKYYKNWYNKQRENEALIYQNSRAELQLLKAQVHPHFLFNTLNNIYALMLDDSPKAITVLNELSGMVLYMTNEGTGSMVPLSKEIKMLVDYIGLEKIRYGERLEIITDIRLNDQEDLLIAPLLMIPFVENSFKHGASNAMDHARIHLDISTLNNQLAFIMSNDVNPVPESREERIKIGLKNVKKRLQILYPEKHSLHFLEADGIFSVTMSIMLEKQKPDLKGDKLKMNASTPVYV
ncbi:MAG TPA: histidine kinase [Puia sp.]